MVYSVRRRTRFSRQPLVQHVQQPLRLHREAVDRVFDLDRRIGVEMPEAAADIGRAAHLPEQPRQALGARRRVGRQEGAELLGEMDQDRAGLEHADRLRSAAIHQRGDLRVRIDRDEAAAELLALIDADQPGVVLGALVARGQQLLQHDGDLHAVRRAQRIKLQRMLADRQLLLMRGAGDRAVDVGEVAAARLVPGPDLRRRVFFGVGHLLNLRLVGRQRGPVARQAQAATAGRLVIRRRKC